MIVDTRERRLTWLALLASAGTLVCCALPIALVAMGLGATVAAISTNIPFLVTLSVYKSWVFGGSALLLGLSGWVLFRPGRVCRADPGLRGVCDRVLLLNRRTFWFAIAIWGTGFFAAYLALPMRIWLEG